MVSLWRGQFPRCRPPTSSFLHVYNNAAMHVMFTNRTANSITKLKRQGQRLNIATRDRLRRDTDDKVAIPFLISRTTRGSVPSVSSQIWTRNDQTALRMSWLEQPRTLASYTGFQWPFTRCRRQNKRRRRLSRRRIYCGLSRYLRSRQFLSEFGWPISDLQIAWSRKKCVCRTGITAADGYSVLPSCLMDILLVDDGVMASSFDAMSVTIQTKPSATVNVG